MCPPLLGLTQSTFFKTFNLNSMVGLISKLIASKSTENLKPETTSTLVVLVMLIHDVKIKRKGFESK